MISLKLLLLSVTVKADIPERKVNFALNFLVQS